MTFDWQSLEDRLYEQSRAVIQQFAAEHPDVTCSFFAYETDPIEGYFMLGFDTYENALRMAQENEQRAIKQRNQMLTQEWSWRHARSMLQSPRLTDYSPDVSYFTYPTYVQLDFQELCDLFESENYPQPANSVEDDYIDGNVQIVLWKVMERLIASEAFAPLHLSAPFHVGYQLHTDGLVVLRILNWPHNTWTR
jgi:hypothetical protein